MSKKSKKRRRRKLSSSSSEEDEKASKDKDVTNNSKTARRKRDVTSQESCAASIVSSTDSQSTRQMKKPIYRLAKTQATDQKPVNEDEDCTKSVHVQSCGGNSSRKAKPDISGKNISVSGSRMEEKELSKPLSFCSTIPQRTERSSKVSSDDKSSQRSPSKLKKRLMSPSLLSADQREHWKNLLKKNCRTQEPQRTRHDSTTVKTREPSKTSSTSKDSSRHNRKEDVKKICQKHQEKLYEARSPSTKAKIPSAATTQPSSALSKHLTSESSSKVLKNITSVPGAVTSVSHKAAKSSPQQQIHSLTPRLPHKFKIPKKDKPRPVNIKCDNNNSISNNRDLEHKSELLDSGFKVRKSMQGNVPQPHSSLDDTPSFSFDGRRDKWSSLSDQPPAVSNATAEPWYDQMQVVEELHLARSEKRLDVNVRQSYGELTCMEIDPPEERISDTPCRKTPQQDLILILDTNILLSHLDYVKKIRSHGLGALGVPVVLIPWVVLQELDFLKKGRGLSGSVAHLATPAISYIHNTLKSREPHLWGQSMQQAAESSDGLNAENNDDRVLQCCLQYQSLYPGCALILCTNDKNLCSKALLSGVRALSKNDLEEEVRGSRDGLCSILHTPMLRHTKVQMSSPVLSRSSKPVQQQDQNRTGLSLGLSEKDGERLNEDGKTKWELSRCVSELEDCLQEVLSDVVEVEMKAAYEDLWLEIVYIKPPWTLQDVLQCLKKHWIAVFGHIVQRRKQQTVLNLIEFFNSGKTMDCGSTLVVLEEAKELVKVFGKSSSRVPSAISRLENIFNKLQPQGESPVGDVVMNDDDEDKLPTSAQVSNQEVWALFENIWSNVCQISLEVFKALGFDLHTMRSAHPAPGPPPPQDALACLHRLSSMVSQLLQAFSSVLSSAPGLEDVQTLFTVIHSNKIVNVDSRFTAKDLLDCFSQQDYREKLRVGGAQLMELKDALDRCVEATGQDVTFST
ncbi:hypothetical protein Q5P01_015747 [Channa striata]|uniref:Transcriptional protein SWT1 n=1 Tax=Channa striata TaxID=64152 RepID=A0AA88MCU0_CHASR|nr:hypothetical protein Q5P01_015747 [Channa striata]